MKADFVEILETRLRYLYFKLYLFQKLNETLKINVGTAKCYVGDTRDMRMIETESVKGIVNSPPYSTALDYIKNDESQLVILGLAESLENLGENMIGNPRKNYNAKDLLRRCDSEDHEFQQIPEFARRIIANLINGGRVDAALRCFKFFIDMRKSLKEMYRVLKKGAKCVIIIGNNHFMVHGRYVEIRNDDVLLEMGKKIGFKHDQTIKRDLQKTSAGNIRYESVLILEK
jgi:DNA modification methylase